MKNRQEAGLEERAGFFVVVVAVLVVGFFPLNGNIRVPVMFSFPFWKENTSVPQGESTQGGRQLYDSVSPFPSHKATL